jgi:hypothetical protein
MNAPVAELALWALLLLGLVVLVGMALTGGIPAMGLA